MKRTIISSLIATSALLSSAAQATNTVNGGTVKFEGQLVSSACALDVSSLNQTVQMGQVRTSAFSKKGDKSSPVAFNIVLTGCKTGPDGGQGNDKTVAVGFSAVQDNKDDKDVISLAGGDGSARGIGLQITDRSKKAVMLDGTPSTEITLNDDRVEVPFTAAYISTENSVTSGRANASVVFTLTYQ
ncbi:fimbrial protein [Aeromonas hydrophila]|uniref:fimbrial protein n=1 Tax=Aeromonas hydrophila TaxID=644 RepID=UPI0038D07F79